MLNCSEELDSAGDPVGVFRGEGGDDFLVRDGDWSVLEKVDELDGPEDLGVVGDPVDAAQGVVDDVHGEVGDDCLVRDVVWSVLEKVDKPDGPEVASSNHCCSFFDSKSRNRLESGV